VRNGWSGATPEATIRSMTSTAQPQRRVDPIAGHVYTVPVVREIPIPAPSGCWDATW
jgi:hypothetical protein